MTNGKHLTHLCERWTTERTDGLQFAFFNGVGYESWENVWGIWNQITPRDAEALRRTSKILRFLGDFVQGGSQWIPHVPVIQDLQSLTFVSEFKTEHQKVWLMVNRNKVQDEIVDLELESLGVPEEVWIDLYHGQFLTPNKNGTIQVEIEAGGYGAIVLVDWIGIFNNLQDFLDEMATLTSKRLDEFSQEWTFLPQEMKDLNMKFETSLQSDRPVVQVPGGTLFFNIQGNCIEGTELPEAVDVQYPWEESPGRHHIQTLDISDLKVDKFPVTNQDYLDFLTESDWEPTIEQNWLRHWQTATNFSGI